jgi:hypothetical protein
MYAFEVRTSVRVQITHSADGSTFNDSTVKRQVRTGE